MLQVLVLLSLVATCLAGKSCTNDLECQWFVELCQYGQCQPNGKACVKLSDCPAPLQCRSLHCGFPVWAPNTKQCTTDLECTLFVEHCQQGHCVTNGKECLTTNDCDSPMQCRWFHCSNVGNSTSNLQTTEPSAPVTA